MKKRYIFIGLTILAVLVLCGCCVLAATQIWGPENMANVHATQTFRAPSPQPTGSPIPLDWKELVNYPSKHKGEYIKILGQVSNIVGDHEFQLKIEGYNIIVIMTKESFSGLYPDSWVFVSGFVSDNACFKNAFGATICQPQLINASFEETVKPSPTPR